MDIIKVAVASRSTAVAGAIAGVMREWEQVDVQAIGAGAVNQAVRRSALPVVTWNRMALTLSVFPLSSR